MNKNVWVVAAIVVIVAAVGFYLYSAGKLPGVQSGGDAINVQSGAAEGDSSVPKPPALPN
ncbi:MAG: hypothetical protein HYY10_00770 [Candidatus Liptonbacteria bacterium]|nr:hypothetical protein [Candidatus Liptonbacteria bacterium]